MLVTVLINAKTMCSSATYFFRCCAKFRSYLHSLWRRRLAGARRAVVRRRRGGRRSLRLSLLRHLLRPRLGSRCLRHCHWVESARVSVACRLLLALLLALALLRLRLLLLRWHRGWQGVPSRVAALHSGIARPLYQRRPCVSAPPLLLLLLLL